MQDNEADVLKISRLLTPEHQADLLAWVNLAYAAETSVRESLGFDPCPNGTFPGNRRSFPVRNDVQRGKK